MRKSFSKTVRSGRSMQRLFYIGRFSNDRLCRHVNAAFLLQCTLFLYNYCVVTPVHCFFFLWTLFLWNDCVVTSMQHFLCIVHCFYISIASSRQCSVFWGVRCFYWTFIYSRQCSVFFFQWTNVASMGWFCRHTNTAFLFQWTLFLWFDCDVKSM